mmetsp:Transcript_10550/g.28867  ORF Transcript_10550/g.28867 Transcript_10550/m.28867 type:complete len:151 (+) Transcript_10550:39-491(+)
MISLRHSVPPSSHQARPQMPIRPAGPRSHRRALAGRPLQRAQVNEETAPAPATPQDPNACSMCGAPLNEKQSGCDGEGRVVGGLSVIPGFGWWPIKAYRPCPELDKRGIDYVRKGQALNDVMFGGGSLGKEGGESFERMKEQADRGLDVK